MENFASSHHLPFACLTVAAAGVAMTGEQAGAVTVAAKASWPSGELMCACMRSR